MSGTGFINLKTVLKSSRANVIDSKQRVNLYNKSITDLFLLRTKRLGYSVQYSSTQNVQ